MIAKILKITLLILQKCCSTDLILCLLILSSLPWSWQCDVHFMPFLKHLQGKE